MSDRDPPSGAAVTALQQSVALMNSNIAVLTATTHDLKETLERIRQQSVTQVEHAALRDRVVKLENEAIPRLEREVEKQDNRWWKAATFVVGLVAIAVIGLVVKVNGVA